MADELHHEIARLQQQVEQLEQKLSRLDERQFAEPIGPGLTGRLGVLATLGPGMVTSINDWVESWHAKGTLPTAETAHLLAAVLRRMIGNRLLILIVALIAMAPALAAVFLVWQQNELLEEQNESFVQRNDLLRQQVQLQIDGMIAARRAELLSTIYDRQDCGAEELQTCLPLANIRSRAEAAQAFVELERSTGKKLANLSRAQLENATLVGGDFSGANLVGAVLRGADLRSANFSGASLVRAELQGANLVLTDLEGAQLRWAELRGSNLGARLRGADMRWADLRGADLTQAFDLDEATLIDALFDDQTVWPENFDFEAAGAKEAPEN
jgi:hypothetical protein